MKTFVKSFIKKKLLGKASAKKHLGKASAKAQSAMEYLMTYGWAILIISIVLAALFQLGVFNPMAFAPKAQPGACQVFRPNGPGTTSFINLEGICTGEIPQYVAQFIAKPPYSYVSISSSSIPQNLQPRTVTLWFNAKTPSTILTMGGGDSASACLPFAIEIRAPNYFFLSTCNDDFLTNLPTSFNTWEFVAATETVIGSNRIITVTLNTQNATQISSDLANTNAPQLTIGGWDGSHVGPMNGTIANVQLYNITLSPQEITALYREGIGGAPINLQHLVGWWPLNGNANDYSGNDNNGHINNVNFVSNWYSSYTPP